MAKTMDRQPRAEEIAEAIDYFMEHAEDAAEFGRNGLKAVEGKYNWKNEEKKLLRLYEEVLYAENV